jgi:hypothetical protein
VLWLEQQAQGSACHCVNMFRVDRRFVLMTNVFNSFVVTCHCVDSDDN